MLKLILVEDSPADVLLFQTMLKEIGVNYSLKVFHKGEAAIDFFEENRELPDAVILDINITSMDGFEVLRWLREHELYHNVKVAMLTSSERKEDKEEAEAHDALFYFKGWDFHSGLQNVKELIEAVKD